MYNSANKIHSSKQNLVAESIITPHILHSDRATNLTHLLTYISLPTNRMAAKPLATRRWRRRPAPWSQSDAFKCVRGVHYAVTCQKSTPCIGALNRGFYSLIVFFFSLFFHFCRYFVLPIHWKKIACPTLFLRGFCFNVDVFK